MDTLVRTGKGDRNLIYTHSLVHLSLFNLENHRWLKLLHSLVICLHELKFEIKCQSQCTRKLRNKIPYKLESRQGTLKVSELTQASRARFVQTLWLEWVSTWMDTWKNLPDCYPVFSENYNSSANHKMIEIRCFSWVCDKSFVSLISFRK